MVQLFEPILEPYMKNLHDNLDSPDLDLVRPSIIIAFSHKNSTLTIVINDNRYLDRLDDIENTINRAYTPRGLKRAKLYGEGEYSIDEERFKRLVIESKEMIKSGDIFQILISNRYIQKGEIDPLSFYRLLRSKNPSPYLFLLDYEEFSICGSSPEVMVDLQMEIFCFAQLLELERGERLI